MKSSEVSTVIFESVNRLFKTLLSIEKVKKTIQNMQRFVNENVQFLLILFAFFNEKNTDIW